MSEASDIMGPASQHHRIGPSSLNYRRMCNAWENRGGTSEAAEEGTLMHAAVETGYDDALDPEQLRQVEKLRKVMEPIKAKATEVHQEVRLPIKLDNGHETFGTCDWFSLQDEPGKAVLADWKFGRLSVPHAEGNLQALAYGVGAFQMFPAVDQIIVYFILPRRDEVTSATLTRDKLLDYIAELTKLFDAVTQPDPPRTVCKACEYCAKADDCPALTQGVVKLDLGQPKDLVLPANTDPATMTVEELDSFGLPFARLAEAWAKAVKKRAMEELESGVTMAHHAIGERTAIRKLQGPIGEAYDVALSLGIPHDEFVSSCNLSIAQVLKAAKRAGVETELTDCFAAAGLLEKETPKTKYLKRK